MSNASAGQTLAALLQTAVEATGVDIEDVAVTKLGRRSEVRVLVDKDGGVSLDDVAQASQAISVVLDQPAADAILGSAPYVLEVSSPGIDRPLVHQRQWRRAVGRLVRVEVVAIGAITGRVLEADAHGVRIAVQAAKPPAASDERTFGFDQLGPGRVQVEFNRTSSVGLAAVDEGIDRVLDLHDEEQP